MKKILLLLTAFILIIGCNDKPEEKKEMSFAGSLPAASKVLSESNYSYKAGDTTISGKITVTQSESKSWPDKPAPVDTVKPPPVDTTTAYVRKNLKYENTFEAANPFASPNVLQTSLTSNITRVANPSGSGYVAKFIVSKSDATYGSSKRSEVNPQISDAKNEEVWTGIQYYFPSNSFVADDAELLQQWHTTASTGSPPLEFGAENGRYYVQQSINPNGGATSDGKNFKRTVLQAIEYNKWNSIVIHYKQGLADGLVEIWINGTKVYNQTGPNTFGAYANYWKYGINKWTWMNGSNKTSQRLFYIDNARYGNKSATYKDVAP